MGKENIYEEEGKDKKEMLLSGVCFSGRHGSMESQLAKENEKRVWGWGG